MMFKILVFVALASAACHAQDDSDSREGVRSSVTVSNQQVTYEAPSQYVTQTYAPSTYRQRDSGYRTRKTYVVERPAPVRYVTYQEPRPAVTRYVTARPKTTYRKVKTYRQHSYAPAPAPYVQKVAYLEPAPRPVTYTTGYAPRTTYNRESSYAPRYEDNYENANYQFAYQVTAGNGYGDDGYGTRTTSDFGHEETRNGDQTNGKYWVELPDGRLQTVEYLADGYSGYIAKVSYSGAEGGRYQQREY